MKTWMKLAGNPALWERYFIREKVLTAVRRFFLDRNFHEVETPYLAPALPPESYLDIFATSLLTREGKKIPAYLPTSPEPFLKKLIVAGIGNCFAMPKSFRNAEESSLSHNPEFTILEWYRVNSDYHDIMRDCEELLWFINIYLARSRKNQTAAAGQGKIIYRGKTVDLEVPWERITVVEAFRKYADIDLVRSLTRAAMVKSVKAKGYRVTAGDSWEQLFHQVFLNEIEPRLGRGKPTIIYDYPASLAALSRRKKSDPRFAERFEFYIEGLELGDAYSELTDWKEQQARFRTAAAERKRLGKVNHAVDYDFIQALKTGMPETGGIAVGVDRLIMLFADTDDIADTLFFPAREEFGLESGDQ